MIMGKKFPAWLMFITNDGDTGGTGGNGSNDGDTGGESQESGKLPESQDELNRIVQGRVKRAEKAVADRYADYEDLRKFRDSHETDIDKATQAAREEARTEVATEYGRKLAEVEVRAAAAGMSFHDPADAVRLVDGLDALVKDGAVDKKAIEAQLKKVAEDKPYLVTEPRRGPKRPGAKSDGENLSHDKTKKPGESRSVQLMRAYGRR